jgi:hypothetical protein
MPDPNEKSFEKDFTDKFEKEAGVWIKPTEKVVVERPSQEDIDRANELQRKDSEAGLPGSNGHK